MTQVFYNAGCRILAEYVAAVSQIKKSRYARYDDNEQYQLEYCNDLFS